jgi:AbrB family looped-hinge helix DNA binding protein
MFYFLLHEVRMETAMRVTSKGQVTIPKAIRDRAGISIGSEVDFRVEGDHVVVERAKDRKRPGMTRGERAVQALRGTATKNRHLSTDEIMKLLRGDD